MSLKHILCIILAIAMILALTACSTKTESNSDSTQAAVQESATAAESVAATTAVETAAAEETAVEAAFPGILYPLNLSAGEAPLITKLRLGGNRAGSEEGINGKDPSTDNIRSVFELNEWIDIYPETELTSLFAYVVPHSDDPGCYTEEYISTLTDKTPKTELIPPSDADGSWGALYLNPEEWSAGYYDLVITEGARPVSYVMITLFNEGELSEKTDTELEELMDEDATPDTAATE